MRDLPSRQDLTICFAHPAYRMEQRFRVRGAPIRHFEVRSAAALRSRVAEVDVLCVSGLWRIELIATAPRLAFIQSISAGTDQYDKAAIAAAGIRLASAQGANERAVAEHAMALILALARKRPDEGRAARGGLRRPYLPPDAADRRTLPARRTAMRTTSSTS